MREGAPMNLTPRQLQALTFIKHHIATRGLSPTMREIAYALDTETGNAKRIVDCLAEHGAITFKPRKRRTIEIVEPKAYRKVLGAGLSTSVECRALAEGIDPETYIKECVRERVEMT